MALFEADPLNGAPLLDVTFDASASTDPDGLIVGYDWDFGDGTSGAGQTISHIFDTLGAYPVTLTVTDDSGTTGTATRVINVTDEVIVPGGALFFDDFEYDVVRGNLDAISIFQAAGWTGGKTEPMAEGGAKGFLYTTNAVPNYTGAYPGINSSSMLAIEALPTTMGDPTTGFWGDMQTDFYLQYGDLNASTENIPGDVWFQFWMMPTGGYDTGMKWIYPCNESYPCHDLHWLGLAGTASGSPWQAQVLPDGSTHLLDNGITPNELPAPDLFLSIVATGAAWVPDPIPYYYSADKLGTTDLAERIVANRWTLVKMHMNTSDVQGTYEVWLKPMGGQWVKATEWIGNVSADFTWPIASPSGHRMFRMPTTVGSPRVLENYPVSYDSITYMDDFTMATSEANLPVYPY